MVYFWVAFAGSIGALLRFSVARWSALLGLNGLPLATFFVNFSGSFLIGFLVIVLEQKWSASDSFKTALITGGLGGFTTFSAFSMEAVHMIQQGEILKSVSYVLSTMVFCLLACALGVYLAKQIV